MKKRLTATISGLDFACEIKFYYPQINSSAGSSIPLQPISFSGVSLNRSASEVRSDLILAMLGMGHLSLGSFFQALRVGVVFTPTRPQNPSVNIVL
jgi:hypothetical protein